jgi:hypothetical protein
MKYKSIVPLMFVVSLKLLMACGGNSDSGNNAPSIQEQTSEGSYRAILRPMNNSLSGFLPTGAAEMTITGDSVQMKTYLDDDAKVTHLQNIHVGTRCPNISDDQNNDGLVDIEEAYGVVGKILIPLDADINSAVDGEKIYPLGGGYTYTETASLSKLENDVKARTNENLNLGGRVVLIHGAALSTKMPTTVATRDSMLMQASVPIVCGIIERK